MEIIFISCSVVLSAIFYFHIKIKNKNIIKNKINGLPQTYGCEHKKKGGNTFFYKDQIYCEFCWNKIKDHILYYNNFNADNKKIAV